MAKTKELKKCVHGAAENRCSSVLEAVSRVSQRLSFQRGGRVVRGKEEVRVLCECSSGRGELSIMWVSGSEVAAWPQPKRVRQG